MTDDERLEAKIREEREAESKADRIWRLYEERAEALDAIREIERELRQLGESV